VRLDTRQRRANARVRADSERNMWRGCRTIKTKFSGAGKCAGIVIGRGEVKPNVRRLLRITTVGPAINALHEAEWRCEAERLLNEGGSCGAVAMQCRNVCWMRGDHPGDPSDKVHHRVSTPCEQETANPNLLFAAQPGAADRCAREQVEEAPTTARRTLIDGPLKKGEQRSPVTSSIVVTPDRWAPGSPFIDVIWAIEEPGNCSNNEGEPYAAHHLKLTPCERRNQFTRVILNARLVRRERSL
jgi:hypothetical protein